ncbi:MAG: hypothetical protein IJ529_01870 [Alphaproteobacteria bacterium]|nr:hypothetical protein [Alphaproteobacteria bacterium]MBR1600042.1 hypothetical protein [Alphaproteobacteria bacterium]
MNNDLEAIYKFAKKHNIAFNYKEDFKHAIINAYVIVGESTLMYTLYTDDGSKRISLCGDVRTELGIDKALVYFEELMLLKGAF